MAKRAQGLGLRAGGMVVVGKNEGSSGIREATGGNCQLKHSARQKAPVQDNGTLLVGRTSDMTFWVGTKGATRITIPAVKLSPISLTSNCAKS
ncbi:cytochrome p450 [Moniliophthora roreri]|nr:cytochrome p450 [Moniliophthora roreri]